MNRTEIADVLENIARLLELKGENAFKIRAYLQGARAIEAAAVSDDVLQDPKQLVELDGVGKALAEKISTLAITGKLPFYEELLQQFPPEVLHLFELQGLGPKKIKVLYEQVGVRSISSLERAIAEGKINTLDGFGPKTAENLLRAIADRKRHAGRYLLSEAMIAADELLAFLREQPEANRVASAGSLRRRKETTGDLDLIVSTQNPEALGAAFIAHPLVETVLAHGKTKCSVLLRSGMQCDLRLVADAEFPFALQYFTGSKEHNVKLRSLALERGWSLNEYRFSIAEGKKKKEPLPEEIRDEGDIYRALGLDSIPAELREGMGEIEAAAEGSLPALVQIENLRGTFHCHTNESDGRATLEEMAAAAQDLGLEYLGIADHSKSSFQAHGLDEARLLRQVSRIKEFNAAQDGFRLFAGTECDILKDGSLDFPDDVLAQLDYVVASIHNSLTQSQADMTKRIIRAISNPHVTMLGHLTGRLLLSREPYAVDIPAIIDAAADTGTIIELNANPRRLDMDWRWWLLAKSKGVRCAINPDAHSTRGLQDLIFGIAAARKGWLTRADIINCLPLGKVERELRKAPANR